MIHQVKKGFDMVKRNTILSTVIFCFCLGIVPETKAVSPAAQTIGGATVALAGGVGAWYFASKANNCMGEGEELEAKQKRYKLLAWLSGGAAAVGAGVGVWGVVRWSRNNEERPQGEDLPQVGEQLFFPVGQEVEVFSNQVWLTKNNDGTVTVRVFEDGKSGEKIVTDEMIDQVVANNSGRDLSEAIAQEEENRRGEKDRKDFFERNERGFECLVEVLRALQDRRPLNHKQKVYFALFRNHPALSERLNQGVDGGGED